MQEELISKLIDLIKVKFFINEVLPTHKLREDLGLDSFDLIEICILAESTFKKELENFNFDGFVKLLSNNDYSIEDIISLYLIEYNK